MHSQQRHAVEQRKTRLTAKQSLRSNVDWLTEVIRRFSEAFALGHDFSTVSMSNVFRYEKVQSLYPFAFVITTHLDRTLAPVEEHRDPLCRP